MSFVAEAARLAGLARSILIYDLKPGQAARLDRLYRLFLREGALAFDIGAHVGNRTRSFRRLGARVVAVEAAPDIARHVRRRFRRDPQVAVVDAAIDAEPGTLELHVSRLHPTVTTGSDSFVRSAAAAPGFGGVRWAETVTVDAVTLDALIAAHGLPDFVKIDIEGMEERALRGLTHAVPALSFEFVPMEAESARACVRRLQMLGPYRFNVALGETMRLEWPAWRDGQALDAWLAGLRAPDRSGDVYAALDPPDGM